GMTIAMGVSANLQGMPPADANRGDRSKSVCSATSARLPHLIDLFAGPDQRLGNREFRLQGLEFSNEFRVVKPVLGSIFDGDCFLVHGIISYPFIPPAS
ncbi:hypothetical protein, partial [Mesorhizobium sp.]|uniref:hypothetical protein n=1 Tax=Mesorhizobium sp. TaxID=1871066 RepID=UPI0025D66D8D